MNTATTLFAPAARANVHSIFADNQLLASAEFSSRLTDLVPCIVLILNKQRQIVFTNKRLLNLLNDTAETDVLGKRPGELFGCIHSTEETGGCGTSIFCRECGAIKALPKYQPADIRESYECRIATKNGEAYEFKVEATPYHHGGKEFTIVSLDDISDKKRRDALEKTFFHDVNNHLNVIMCYAEILGSVKEPDTLIEYSKIIQSSGKELCEEIGAHRRLLQAEKGELSLDIRLVESLNLLGDTLKTFYDNEQWRDRKIDIDMSSEVVGMLTDRTLLLRVLGNMLKNALEATADNDRVRLACHQDGEQVVFSVHNPGMIPQSVQLQLFKRSFSTKGEGRGIGTYSMKLFGEQYLKGKVWFVSTEVDGTTFYMSLPLEHPSVPPVISD